MTVMPSGTDVADKAVSTEDATSGAEVVRLEAVLAALVETKVEAMKASSATGTAVAKKSGSAPPSPRRPRLTSSSTASSSQNQHHHHHYHHTNRRNGNYHGSRNHQHYRRDNNRHGHEAKKRDAHRHRRHDSAPCGDYIENPTSRDHHKQRSDKSRRRASEMPRSPRKKRRHSKSGNVLRDVNRALDSRFELLDIDADQDLALINFERTREALSDTCDYPGLHRSVCYLSHSSAHLHRCKVNVPMPGHLREKSQSLDMHGKSYFHLSCTHALSGHWDVSGHCKIHYDEDDYVALNLEDELEEEDSLSGPERRDDKRERYHRPRRKRKRRRRIVEPEVPEEEYVDPEELPPRARWTIVATACLLLAMSLLLVGVTLRMAPIIDDMGDGRRSSVCRKGTSRRTSTAAVCPVGSGGHRKDSVRPTARVEIRESTGKIIVKSPLQLEQERRHRKITMIVIGTFLFLLIASILVVVVTLTHSSFHIPAIGSRELADHRAQRNHRLSVVNETLRKQNEELWNSLKRDPSVPENATAPP